MSNKDKFENNILDILQNHKIINDRNRLKMLNIESDRLSNINIDFLYSEINDKEIFYYFENFYLEKNYDIAIDLLDLLKVWQIIEDTHKVKKSQITCEVDELPKVLIEKFII